MAIGTETHFHPVSEQDIGAIRSAIRSRPLKPLDELDSVPKPQSRGLDQDIELLMTQGWTIEGLTIPSLAPPIDWDGYPRSISYHLHAWEPLSLLLKGHSKNTDCDEATTYFDCAFAFARHWIASFSNTAEPISLSDSADDGGEDFAWYDMAVGQRTYRLAYMLDVIARDTRYEDEAVSEFLTALRFHIDLLSDDRFFRDHSNHGLYQALGQLAATTRFSWLPGFEAARELAENRLLTLIERHFTKSNVHKEHSPGYHYMVLWSLIGAARSGLITNSETQRRLDEMQRVFSWMVQPDRTIVAIGDTNPRDLGRFADSAQHFSEPTLSRLIAGQGSDHSPPLGVQAFDDAGYAFVRHHPCPDSARFEDCSYLALQAGFHSRVHKQADHLSFVWYDQGGLVLADPGRYRYSGRTKPGSTLFKRGFWYSDPGRIYVESTRAHNTIEIDGESYPRNRVTPFGSALKDCGEQGGMAVLECEYFPIGRVRHYRALIMKQREFLIVIDWLHDRTGTLHDYRQWFTLAPPWELVAGPSQWTAQHLDADKPCLQCAPLLTGSKTGENGRGREEPDMLGWVSDHAAHLVPASTACFEQTGTATAHFATIWTFAQSLQPGPRSRANASLRTGRLDWTADGRNHLLHFDRQTSNRLELSLEQG